jgi:hypothetical protein
MNPVQIISGTKISIDGKTSACLGLWCRGDKITRYIFESSDKRIFEVSYEDVQKWIDEKTIEKR